MNIAPTVFRLYVPSFSVEDGPSQPLATALSLDAGKNLCHHHFLKRCRTFQQRLPREQNVQLRPDLLETLTIRWSQLPSGDYEGRLESNLPPALSTMTRLTYRLHPAP